MEAAYTDVQMDVGQWKKKTGSARAPPVKKFSLKTSKDGRKYVLVDKQQGRFIGLSNIEAERMAKESSTQADCVQCFPRIAVQQPLISIVYEG